MFFGEKALELHAIPLLRQDMLRNMSGPRFVCHQELVDQSRDKMALGGDVRGERRVNMAIDDIDK